MPRPRDPPLVADLPYRSHCRRGPRGDNKLITKCRGAFGLRMGRAWLACCGQAPALVPELLDWLPCPSSQVYKRR
jgi:hypothetical protein